MSEETKAFTLLSLKEIPTIEIPWQVSRVLLHFKLVKLQLLEYLQDSYNYGHIDRTTWTKWLWWIKSKILWLFFPHRDKRFGFVLSSDRVAVNRGELMYLGPQLRRHHLIHRLAARSYTIHTWGFGPILASTTIPALPTPITMWLLT